MKILENIETIHGLDRYTGNRRLHRLCRMLKGKGVIFMEIAIPMNRDENLYAESATFFYEDGRRSKKIEAGDFSFASCGLWQNVLQIAKSRLKIESGLYEIDVEKIAFSLIGRAEEEIVINLYRRKTKERII